MTFRLYRKDPAEVAQTLKDEIKEKLGFTVNVGVGSNKLLAKMASDFEKPDKVHTLWQDEVQEKNVAAAGRRPALGRQKDKGKAVRIRDLHDRRHRRAA